MPQAPEQVVLSNGLGWGSLLSKILGFSSKDPDRFRHFLHLEASL